MERVAPPLARVRARVPHSSIDHISMRDISTFTGASESTLYRYFDTKEELVQRVYEECWRRLALTLAELTFIPKTALSPTRALRSDIVELASVYFSADDDLCAIVTCAFFMYRRSSELGLSEIASRTGFFLRLRARCRIAGIAESTALELVNMLISFSIVWSMSPNIDEEVSLKEFEDRVAAKISAHKSNDDVVDLPAESKAESLA